MKKKLKHIVRTVVILALTVCFMIIASNISEVKNIICNYEYHTFEKEDVILYNWNKEGERLISGEDPQIILMGIQGYVNNLQLDIVLESIDSANNNILIYYTEMQDEVFTPEKCIKVNADKTSTQIPINIHRKVQDLRIDVVEEAGVKCQFTDIQINPRKIGLKPVDIVLWAIMLAGIWTIYYFRAFLLGLYKERELIFMLVHNDLKSRYAGSFFGLIWAFVQPLITVLIFWLVFELGFKTLPIDNVRFILWFIQAYIPWIYFSDAVINSAGCLREYSYLVKKMKFPIEVLPIVKVFASLIIHLFFIALMSIVYVLYKYKVTIMAVQVVYYLFAVTCFLIGLAWLTSAIAVFMKDFTQIISIILQIGFFIIPVFWNDAEMSPKVLTLLKFNPVFYVIQGYRDSMLNSVFFWKNLAGIKLFQKLRKHFADLI